MRRRSRMRSLLLPLAVLALALAGCGSPGSGGTPASSGSVDTLSSGQVVARNAATPLWGPDSGWRVTEELRVGQVDGDGPDTFGRITSFEVDGAGRLWVFDSQSQQLQVFGATGDHVRSVGRRGGGPGEFAQAVRVEQGPDGHMWVMDPQNNRISVFDTAGEYLRAHPALGGFIMFPWPGRFDASGHYYAPVPRMNGGFSLVLVRHDAQLAPLDTLQPPVDPVTRDRFEYRGSGGHGLIAGVPYQGTLVWRLSPEGTIWAMITDQYRLFELSPAGDTLRTITREFTPLPVTGADREQAREDLEWFTNQGGQIDLSRLPRTKPATMSFFRDDEGHIWVEQVTVAEETGHVHDVFDPDGRFLGTVRLPFPLSRMPEPIVRRGVLYGVTQSDLGVQYVVRARIVKPGREMRAPRADVR
jgi:hypothetical protein